MRDRRGVPGPPLPPHARPGLLLLVMAGGVAGALLRYGLTAALPQHGLPTTTLGINISGALLLGVLMQVLAGRPDDGRRRAVRLAIGSGLLGAFTTYSTLAVEAVLLVRQGDAPLAVAYGVLSVLAGLVAAALGIALGTVLTVRRPA